MNQSHDENPPGEDYIHPLAKPLLWVESKWAHASAFWVLLAAAVGLALLDLLHVRHEYLPWAEAFGFYALMGFGSFVLAVQVGRLLRLVLRRDEDYYDGAGGDD